MRPDPDQIVEDARKLQQERFGKRDTMLKDRAAERFNEKVYEVPKAYDTTGHRHRSSIPEDEGRQIATLVYAMPVPHIPAAVPEDQPLTTTEEKFLIAWHAEMETHFGPVWWQNTTAQAHDNIAWLYCGWRKVPYKGQPKAPDEQDIVATAEYGIRNDRFKRDAGVKSFCDYRYVPTGTAYAQGNVYDPDRFYEIKQVPERDLMTAYGVVKDKNSGAWSKPSKGETTTPSGYPEGYGTTETLVKVVEYWDREWCVIAVEGARKTWGGLRETREGFILDEWQHNWGRTPYFARPAFVTDQLDEDKRFAGPLDALYTEMPEHKMLRNMGFAVAHQTAFSPLVIETEKDGDQIVDDSGNALTFVGFKPAEARQLAPGQKVGPLGQSPEVRNLFAEIAASQARIEHYSLSPVAKGVSPGADTANAALSNLHRFQLSTLDPLAQQASRQASAMYRFALERVKESGERVFVFSSATDAYLSLAPEEVVSVNCQAKVTPDQGQFQLLIEKHAMELWLSGAITELEFHELRGKESPEEYVEANMVERLRKTIEPVVLQQIISDLGMMDAINQMVQANAQTGDARNAIPAMEQQAEAMDTGMGKGSPGQPRDNGVRSPAVSTTTQPAMEQGSGY